MTHDPLGSTCREGVVSDSTTAVYGTGSGMVLAALQRVLLPILGQARRVLAELPVSDPARRRVATLERALTGAADLVGRDLQPLAPSPMVVDLPVLVRDVLHLVEGTMGGGVPIVLVARADLPQVTADEALMRHLVIEAVLAVGEGAHGKLVRLELEAVANDEIQRGGGIRMLVRVEGRVGHESQITPKGSVVDRLPLAPGLARAHGGELTATVGGLKLLLPGKPRHMPESMPRSMALGLDDGSAAMAFVDASLRASGFDVTTTSHAPTATGLCEGQPHVAALFATADDHLAPCVPWLLGMARLHPHLPCILVVPDGLEGDVNAAAETNPIVSVAARGLAQVLAAVADRGAGRKAD